MKEVLIGSCQKQYAKKCDMQSIGLKYEAAEFAQKCGKLHDLGGCRQELVAFQTHQMNPQTLCLITFENLDIITHIFPHFFLHIFCVLHTTHNKLHTTYV